jgi:hypothetical protein
MANKKIRIDLLTYGIKHYELAAAVGISEFTLSRWLRKKLPDDKKIKILAAIKKLAEGVRDDG